MIRAVLFDANVLPVFIESQILAAQPLSRYDGFLSGSTTRHSRPILNAVSAAPREPEIWSLQLQRQEEAITYVIEKSTDLINWVDFATVTDAHGPVGGEAKITVPAAEMESGKFFLRLRVEKT